MVYLSVSRMSGQRILQRNIDRSPPDGVVLVMATSMTADRKARTNGIARLVGLVAVALVASIPTSAPARVRHRHRVPAPRTAAPSPPASFYPETIEGGSPGNLPFNNQIRKLTDPLNANGAGR